MEQCCPINVCPCHLKGKTLSCSKHLNLTLLWTRAEILHSKCCRLTVKFCIETNSTYTVGLLYVACVMQFQYVILVITQAYIISSDHLHHHCFIITDNMMLPSVQCSFCTTPMHTPPPKKNLCTYSVIWRTLGIMYVTDLTIKQQNGMF
jgi:hypothetical protein